MLKYVKQAFEKEGVVLPLSSMVPSKPITDAMRKSPRYECIKSLIEVCGVIQPLVVYPCEADGPDKGKFRILDGHLRWDILNSLGHEEEECIISTDDEGYTYNHKVNRVSTIQSHYMIMKIIKEGVPEERIAMALNVDVEKIKEQRNLLKDICKEAIDILKDKNISSSALAHLRKVKPVRQVFICTVLKNANNFSETMTKCLVSATPDDLLVTPKQNTKKPIIDSEGVKNIQAEIENLENDYASLDETYRDTVYKFMLARGYIEKLMKNAKVVRYLAEHHGEMFNSFNKVMSITVPDEEITSEGN